MLGIPAVRLGAGRTIPRHAYTRPPGTSGDQLAEWGDTHGFDVGPGDGGWLGYDIYAPGPIRLLWRRTPAELRAALLAGWGGQ